jgi:hypothetical protein
VVKVEICRLYKGKTIPLFFRLKPVVKTSITGRLRNIFPGYCLKEFKSLPFSKVAKDFYGSLKYNFMRSILYLIAVVLIIGWLLGVFVYSLTGLIHILIVLAIVSLLLGLIRSGSDA